MTQPGIHAEPGDGQRNDYCYQDQLEEAFTQLIEQIPTGSPQYFPDPHLLGTRRARKHYQYPQSQTRDENSQTCKTADHDTEHLVLPILMIEELVEEEEVVTGIFEITMPDLLNL